MPSWCRRCSRIALQRYRLCRWVGEHEHGVIGISDWCFPSVITISLYPVQQVPRDRGEGLLGLPPVCSLKF